MIDFKFCEIDSNYVPTVEVEGEIACQYCWEAYGEINQVSKIFSVSLDKPGDL